MGQANPRVSLSARPALHFAYSGKALLIADRQGWMRKGAEGFYHENTRFLSRFEITLQGRRPKPSGVSPVGHDSLLGHYVDRNTGTPHTRPISLSAKHFVENGLATILNIHNYSRQKAHSTDLELHLDADFADIEEAQQGKRRQEAPVERHWDAERQELTFDYPHPRLELHVIVHVQESQVEARWAEGALRIPLHLSPGDSQVVRLTVEPVLGGQRRQAQRWSFAPAGAPLARLRENLAKNAPRLHGSNATVTSAWRTAIADLASLPLGLEEGPATPIAGLPAYHNFFGRDTLTTAWQALMAIPAMMRDTLNANAAWRGTKIDDYFDEEPGKLINRAHWGPLSQLGMEPFLHYYGDYATPMDFLIGYGQYLAWTNDRRTARELLPAVRSVLEWTQRYADIDGDGFVEYLARTDAPKRIREKVRNQGWKDAPDAIRDEHGREVENPIATCELQGYLYEGLRQTAQALLLLGERGYAMELLERARKLKHHFNQHFWMEDQGYYALGLDPDKQQIRSIASNAGHLLATGIVPPERAGRVVERLMADDMFSGWGIRTLSSRHPAYNPFSYHLGTVWPVENATIALGFARYGYWRAAQRVAEGVFAASDLFIDNRLPEAMGGMPRDETHPHPGVYPQANEPQAWSASAVVLLIQTLLGVRAFAPARVLLLDPHLPEWLPDLHLEGLRVGNALLDLEAWRDEQGQTRFKATPRTATAVAIRVPPAHSVRSLARLRNLAGL